MRWVPKNTWRFSVLSEPKAQPRAKATAWGGKARMWTPGTADSFKQSITLAAREAIGLGCIPIDAPVETVCVFYMPRPKRLMTKSTIGIDEIPHICKPDGDNLEKAVWDALKSGGVLRDDSIVFKSSKAKFYAEADGIPRVEIMVIEYGEASNG